MEFIDPSTYYQSHRDKILHKAHQIVKCACGENVKYGATSSHCKHSPRHRIYEQMRKSVDNKTSTK